MFGYGAGTAQQNQFAEQARQRRPIAYILPHPEFEERHVGGVNALDLSCYDESNDTSGKKRKVLASAGRDASGRGKSGYMGGKVAFDWGARTCV